MRFWEHRGGEGREIIVSDGAAVDDPHLRGGRGGRVCSHPNPPGAEAREASDRLAGVADSSASHRHRALRGFSAHGSFSFLSHLSPF